MSTEIAKGSNLPANVLNMAAALASSASMVGARAGGELYMRFTKYGDWEFGAENVEVQEGSVWAINPHGLQHGWIAWGTKEQGTDGQNVGEVLVSATQPMPDRNNLPEVRGEWSSCIAVQMRCTNGDDEGIQVIWKSNSRGGRNAYADIVQAIVTRIGEGHAQDCVPLVELTADSYQHKTYGKIFTPVVDVVGWANMDGEAVEKPARLSADEKPARREAVAASAPEPAEAVEEAPAAPPRRRRQRAAS